MTPTEDILSQEKGKIQSQNTKLEDYSSGSSLINPQLKILENFDFLGLTVQQQQMARDMILK